MRWFPFVALLLVVSPALAQRNPLLSAGSRTDQDGWIVLHLRGTPSEIGFRRGYLCAAEIDEALQMFRSFLKGLTGKDWSFYHDAAKRIFWPKIPAEYREELQGIVDGLAAYGSACDVYDIVAMNGWMELAWSYVPSLANAIKADSMNNRAPGNCSAFIATGKETKDGRIVMAHNAWVDYVVGERWNLVLDITPSAGHRIMMDSFPGWIHSGDDFAMNDAGILITETTITGFKGFDSTKTPEFVRARRAEQYTSSIEDFVQIMTADNNGAYANTWLVGNINTNEIAKLDLGLKNQRLWRTKDGIFSGSNFGTDEKLLKEETTFQVDDRGNSPNARRTRWGQVANQYAGAFDAGVAMAVMGDHVNANTGKTAADRCELCGHADTDPQGIPEWGNPPFYPTGATNAKVTTTELARNLKFWGRMGHPCGQAFNASAFLSMHPEFKWQEPYLRDMPTRPWTLLSARP